MRDDGGTATDAAASTDGSILGSRRFLPLFVTQFLGALNDNLFKTAMAVLIVYDLLADSAAGPILANLAAGVFILPFVLFSAPAGRLADRMDKARLVRIVKLCEIGILLLGGLGLVAGSVAAMFGALFLLGVHSTVFGPIKYGILPQLLPRQSLATGNALVEGGTFVAILIGQIFGAMLVLRAGGPVMIAVLGLLLAGAGYAASRGIPATGATAPGLVIDPNFLRDGWRLVRALLADRGLAEPTLALSWFWLFGATCLQQVPALTRVAGGDGDVVTLILGAFTVGIAAGSLLCSRLMHGEIHVRMVRWGALGMSLAAIEVWLACAALPAAGTPLGLGAFLLSPPHLRLVLDLFVLSLAGGLFSVPLYAVIQVRSAPADRARVFAAGNVLNALFMVAGALGSAALLGGRLSDIPGLYLLLGLLNIPVAIVCFRWVSPPAGGPGRA